MTHSTFLWLPRYNLAANKYGKNCGAKTGKADGFGQLYWEMKGWIDAQDPYGWFQW
jgi:hypothetical protein